MNSSSADTNMRIISFSPPSKVYLTLTSTDLKYVLNTLSDVMRVDYLFLVGREKLPHSVQSGIQIPCHRCGWHFSRNCSPPVCEMGS